MKYLSEMKTCGGGAGEAREAPNLDIAGFNSQPRYSIAQCAGCGRYNRLVELRIGKVSLWIQPTHECGGIISEAYA